MQLTVSIKCPSFCQAREKSTCISLSLSIAQLGQKLQLHVGRPRMSQSGLTKIASYSESWFKSNRNVGIARLDQIWGPSTLESCL